MIAHVWHTSIGSVFRAWFDDRPLEAIANELEAIDIEWIEVWDCHCSPEEHDPGMFRCTLGEHGVSIAGYGVVDLNDTGVVRKYAVFANRLGVAYLPVQLSAHARGH